MQEGYCQAGVHKESLPNKYVWVSLSGRCVQGGLMGVCRGGLCPVDVCRDGVWKCVQGVSTGGL